MPFFAAFDPIYPAISGLALVAGHRGRGAGFLVLADMLVLEMLESVQTHVLFTRTSATGMQVVCVQG